jgi:hypothetical protein
MAVIEFITRSGSTYKIDTELLTWKRDKSERGNIIRRDSGKLVHLPELKLGQPAVLHDDQVEPGSDVHLVVTTPIAVIRGTASEVPN